MKYFLRYATLVLLFQSFIVRGQSKTSVNGVYAGVEIMPSAMGGMGRNDVVISAQVRLATTGIGPVYGKRPYRIAAHPRRQ
jgi:hypothetical protein